MLAQKEHQGMKIANIDKMELIVNNNSSMYWLGWDVMFLEEDPMAYMNSDAVFKNDRWHKKTSIKNTDGVWNIPENVIKKINV